MSTRPWAMGLINCLPLLISSILVRIVRMNVASRCPSCRGLSIQNDRTLGETAQQQVTGSTAQQSSTRALLDWRDGDTVETGFSSRYAARHDDPRDIVFNSFCKLTERSSRSEVCVLHRKHPCLSFLTFLTSAKQTKPHDLVDLT